MCAPGAHPGSAAAADNHDGQHRHAACENGSTQPAANGSSAPNGKAATSGAAVATGGTDGRDERDSSFERRVRRAKRAARSELSVSKGEWRKWGYAAAPGLLDVAHLADGLERVDASNLSVEQFVERYERPRRPVMLTGLCGGWRAAHEWTPDKLLERLGECKFKVGSDDDGYAVRLKLKHFLAYCSHPEHAPADDSPLYVFAHLDRDREEGKALLRDYEVPPLFAEDLMRLAGERRRPPYRWFVCGPARSGTNMHVDPLATSAWNTLLQGHKRWVLFPPGTPNSLIKPKGVEREAAAWFTHVWPRTQAPDWLQQYKPIDVVQHPGETMFVPAGWPHAVMNLDMTVAVTQNYVSTATFADAWRHTKRGRPKMSAKWLAVLREQRPDLAAVADQLAAEGNDESGSSSSSSSSSSSDSSSDSSSSSSSDSSEDEAAGGSGRPAAKRRRTEGGGEAAERQAGLNGVPAVREQLVGQQQAPQALAT